MADYVKLKDDEGKRRKRYRINYKAIILIVIFFFLLSSLISGITYSMTPKIALVNIKGVTMTEASSTIYGDSISSREIADILYSFKDDPSIKGVILDINSPGGSPVSAEEISRAIEDTKVDIPVYALVNDMAASGAMWISVSANKTYASRLSTMGSIGVTSATLGFEEFIKEYNITYRKQTAGNYKDIGTPFRTPSKEEEEIIQEMLDEIHGEFISHIAKSRNLSINSVEEFSDGQVFLGSRALELGLIDEIGYLQDVVSDMQEITGEGTILVEFGPQKTLLEELGIDSVFQLPKTLVMLS